MKMDAKQAMQVVEERLQAQPLSAVHQTFGHCNVTYEVTLPGRSVIVRMNREAKAFATTAQNLMRLTALRLPVPKVLAVDTSRERVPFAYMILEKIPGRDLRYELTTMSFEQMTRLATQLVRFQRDVGRLEPGCGYGYVGIGETGPYPSWWELIAAEDQATPTDDLAPFHSRMQIQKRRFESYFRSVPPTCFLDDITGKNVIVQSGVLQGLVDFDCVCYGDPLYWMALTTVGIVSDVGVRELFYTEELKRLWGLMPAQEPILALYSAEMALDFLRHYARSETPEWNARMRTAIKQWLAQAEQ